MLLKMGIRECFMQWIEFIYASQIVEIWIEGQKSEKIVITRGCPPYCLMLLMKCWHWRFDSPNYLKNLRFNLVSIGYCFRWKMRFLL